MKRSSYHRVKQAHIVLDWLLGCGVDFHTALNDVASILDLKLKMRGVASPVDNSRTVDVFTSTRSAFGRRKLGVFVVQVGRKVYHS